MGNEPFFGFHFSWKYTSDLYKKCFQETQKSPKNPFFKKSTIFENLAVAQARGPKIEKQNPKIEFFKKLENIEKSWIHKEKYYFLYQKWMIFGLLWITLNLYI